MTKQEAKAKLIELMASGKKAGQARDAIFAAAKAEDFWGEDSYVLVRLTDEIELEKHGSHEAWADASAAEAKAASYVLRQTEMTPSETAALDAATDHDEDGITVTPRRPGRPALPPELKRVSKGIRLPQSSWDKIADIGQEDLSDGDVIEMLVEPEKQERVVALGFMIGQVQAVLATMQAPRPRLGLGQKFVQTPEHEAYMNLVEARDALLAARVTLQNADFDALPEWAKDDMAGG